MEQQQPPQTVASVVDEIGLGKTTAESPNANFDVIMVGDGQRRRSTVASVAGGATIASTVASILNNGAGGIIEFTPFKAGQDVTPANFNFSDPKGRNFAGDCVN